MTLDHPVLPVAVPEGGPEGLEPGDMAREFENSKDSEDSKDLCSLGDILDGVLGGEEVEQDRDKEGEDAKKVNNVKEGKEKVNLKYDK